MEKFERLWQTNIKVGDMLMAVECSVEGRSGVDLVPFKLSKKIKRVIEVA